MTIRATALACPVPLWHNGAVQNVRVLFAIARYPPDLGGTERQAALLARWLARRGHRVTVVTQAHPPLPPRSEEHGVAVVRLVPPAGGRGSSALFALRLACFLRREGRAFDLFQAFLASSPALVIRRAAQRAARPAFLKFGASGPMGDAATSLATLVGRWKLGRLRGGFARYLCPNEEIRREFLALGYPAERLTLLPNGVDTDLFRPPDRLAREEARRARGWEGRTVALFTGRFAPQKNLPGLLAAWRDLAAARPEALLVLAGEGGERGRLDGEVRARGLGNSVHLLSAEGEDGVRRLLQGADIFVLPSLAEGLSNALLEAMAAGVAPAASDIPGNRELLARLPGGLLFDPAMPTSLQGVLARLLDDRRLREAAAVAARREILEGYSLEVTGSRYLALVREVLHLPPAE